MEKIEEMEGVSKTLFIPLVARARESKSKQPVLSDKKAEELLEQVDLGDMIVDGGAIATLGILARTKIIDEAISKLVEQGQKTIIISLGVGLDTRFSRLKGKEIEWYDLDLPEVISLRRKLLAGEAESHLIAKSVLDESWPAAIQVAEGEQVIIVAEGILMYFQEDEVKKILEMIIKHFPGAHVFFDVVHSFFVNKKISSPFHWGIDRASDILEMNEAIELVQSWSMGDLLKHRQSIIMRLLNKLPSTRNRSQILHCRCLG